MSVLRAAVVLMSGSQIVTPSVAQMNVERLQKMAGTVRTGGKGTVRR